MAASQWRILYRDWLLNAETFAISATCQQQKNMDLDAPICLCFHVSRRKIVRFIKVNKPRRASQLSECFGAGTGCGWCRGILERLHQEHSATGPTSQAAGELAPLAESIDQELDSLNAQQYQSDRQAYRDRKREQTDEAGLVDEADEQAKAD